MKIIIDSFVRIARFVEFKIVGNFKLKRNALSNIRAGIETGWTKFPVTSKILVKYVQKKKGKRKRPSENSSSWPNNIEATCFFVKRHSVPLYRETTNWALSFFISFERRQSVGDVGHAIRRANEGIGFPTGGK